MVIPAGRAISVTSLAYRREREIRAPISLSLTLYSWAPYIHARAVGIFLCQSPPLLPGPVS